MIGSPPATILLVDDSEDNRYAVRRYLERAGFLVTEATSGRETLQMVGKNPDLVILDIDLPDTNGFEVCRLIKSNPTSAPIPVLHLSATFTHTRDRVQGLDGGADGYLTHPVEPLELVATVNALLRMRRAEQALRDADRRKDEFLAMLAHELRNPLSPIRTAVQVLKLRDSVDSTVKKALEIVERQVTHMSRLIDDLLDVSRIAQGKVTIRQETCDLSQVVLETANDYRSMLEAQNLTLEMRLPATPILVAGDKIRLSQIIGNLLHNARKFTDPGGTITIEVSTQEDQACFCISDTGIGMDPDTLLHIFEPFSQADRSLDRSRGGLGLGLALVQGLMELHGGKVEASSEGLGKGSTFTLCFPLEAIAESAVADRMSEVPPVPTCRVLVIEDNTDAAQSLELLLGVMGHEVATTRTGQEGVERAQTFEPHLILCDIGLPGGMDGFAVAHTLRKIPRLQEVFLVALTGYGQQEDREKALAAGFDVHLTKPVDVMALDQVFKAVSQSMEKKAERR
jgi:signal transduction histidine kinase